MKISEHLRAILHGVAYTLIVELILVGFKKGYEMYKETKQI